MGIEIEELTFKILIKTNIFFRSFLNTILYILYHYFKRKIKYQARLKINK